MTSIAGPERHGAVCRDQGLPALSDPYPLRDAQIEQYRRDGFVVLDGFLSGEEIAEYAPALRDDAMDLIRASGMGTTFSGAFHQLTNVRHESAALEAYCLNPRIGEVTARLAGVDRMRIYHDQVLFKPPAANPTFWHQDMYFWPLATDASLGTWLPLADVSEAQGAMRYARGSHLLGNLGQHSIDAESEAFFENVVEEHGLDVVQLDHVGAGDLCVHNGWMVHGATANRSNAMREAVVVVAYPDGTRVAPFVNPFHAYDAATHLGGRAEGELADSARNPIL